MYIYPLPDTTSPALKLVLDTFTFKDDKGQIVEWSAGQLEIMECIVNRSAPDGKKRVHIMTTTQYGKSMAVAAAVAGRAALKKGAWAIVAGDSDKAQIIMDYIITFVVQDPLMSRLLISESKVEKLREHKSKDRITFRGAGEVRTFSGDARNRQTVGNSLMGFGAPNVIEDESALIPNDVHAKVMRMLGGHKDNFLIKIGNPFNRNHFLTSYHSDKYYHIAIDYRRAIQEGRLTASFVDEMRTQPFFSVFYEVKFPDADSIIDGGWLPLLTDINLHKRIVPRDDLFGELRLGCDVAGEGRNFSTIVIKSYNCAMLIYKKNEPDSMQFAKDIQTRSIQLSIRDENIFIDKVGAGKGAYDRVQEFKAGGKSPVSGINAGNAADRPDVFFNKRAEMYWRLREWLLRGGKLIENPDWNQLTQVFYKASDSGKIQIMGKDEMLRRGIQSPDVADALALTFARGEEVLTQSPLSTEATSPELQLDPYATAQY